MNKQAIIFWTFIALAAIGILTWLGNGGLSRIIIPLVVFGVVFLLYKYPPRRWARKTSSPKIKPSAKTMAKVNAQSGTRKSSGSSKNARIILFRLSRDKRVKVMRTYLSITKALISNQHTEKQFSIYAENCFFIFIQESAVVSPLVSFLALVFVCPAVHHIFWYSIH